MSYTPDDAEREMAYDAMVEEILEANASEIIENFQSDRLASYYRAHLGLASPAVSFLEQAKQLKGQNNSAALVMAYAATEFSIKNLLLKPVVSGLIHDESVDELIANIAVKSNQFKKLLFDILASKGLNINEIDVSSDPAVKLESEINRIGKIRNGIVHRCDEATEDDAQCSINLAETILLDVFPRLLRTLGVEISK